MLQFQIHSLESSLSFKEVQFFYNSKQPSVI